MALIEFVGSLDFDNKSVMSTLSYFANPVLFRITLSVQNKIAHAFLANFTRVVLISVFPQS